MAGHTIQNQDSYSTVEGYGYQIVRSCTEIIEVPPSFGSAEAARQMAMKLWSTHAQDR